VRSIKETSLVRSADIYLTPYRYEAQAVSGTFAYSSGAGKRIVSTPYWHTSELLADGRGELIPFEDPAAIADVAIELRDNQAAREARRRHAYLYARHMVWDRVAQSQLCRPSYELPLVASNLPARRCPYRLPRRTLQAD